MKKRILVVSILLIVLAAALTLSVLFLLPQEETDDLPTLLGEKADNDFSDLFRLADSRGDALAAVTVQDISEVSDLIERYEVTDTLYTKLTLSVEHDYTDSIEGNTVTVYLLGNAENFPSREKMAIGNQYLLRLESWVHETGIIYLINPLESTYLRIFNGDILVRDDAATPNYRTAMPLDEFPAALASYRADNPPSESAVSDHHRDIVATLEGYDYQNKDLAYRPTEAARQKRLQLAKSLVK